MKRSVVVLALILAALAIHVRVLAGNTWDDVEYHAQVAPPRLAAASQIHAGVFPRWWDGTSWGVPLFAEPSHGAGDPLMWIGATPHALDLVLVLHFAWLALGIGLWARRAGASELAAIGAGVLAISTGIVTSAALRGALPSIADLPWIGWAALGLARAQTRGTRMLYAALIGGLLGAIALAGEMAAVLDAIAIAIVVGGGRATVGWLGGAIAAGLAIGGAQWIPALSHAGAGAELHGIGLARLVELVVPGAFGSLEPARGVAAIGGGDPSQWPSLFFGAALLALALAYRPDRRRDRGLAIGLALAALLVGRGGWSIHRGAPEVHAACLAIVLAVRAARGLDGVLANDKRARNALAIAAAVAMVATWCIVALRDASLPAIDRALFDGGLGCACLIGAYAAAAARRARLAFALALLPSLIAVRSTEPITSADVVEKQPRWVTDGLAAIRTPPRRLYRARSLAKTPEIALADAIATIYGDSGARWGIDAARSDDPARMPEEAAAWAASSHNGGQLFERLGIGLAVLPRSVAEGGNMRELDRVDDAGLVQVPTEPPAVTMSNWEWVPDAATAFKTLFPANGARGVPVDHAVLIGSGPSQDSGGVHHANTCEIVRWAAGAIELSCKAPSNAYAIVDSSAIAGWTVAVDGIATPWVGADGVRRAVYVTAGTHRIEWRYHAPGLDGGLVVAAFGLAACLAAAALGFATRKR